MTEQRTSAFHEGSLQGKLAVVTGACGGLGSAIVQRLFRMGATVVLLDLQSATPDGGGDKALFPLACDISEEDSVAAAARVVADRFGRCDVLVNNAAILPAPVPLQSLSVATWDKVMAVNVRGGFLCAKHFGIAMLAQGSGSIVNLASVAASAPNATGVYGPSKAAVLGLTRQIAVEWGPHGIRANAVSPGLVRTAMSEHFYQDKAVHEARVAVVPSRRIAVPDDIAEVVAFLASDAAAYVNGQEIVVDGGFLLNGLMHVQVISNERNQ